MLVDADPSTVLIIYKSWDENQKSTPISDHIVNPLYQTSIEIQGQR